MTEGGCDGNMDGKDFLEDEFCIVVLSRAKELFGGKAKYLTSTRMVKLAAFVADDTNFDLTRGWYKFGDFSPSAYMITKDYSEDNLINLEPPKDLIYKSFEEFEELIPSIDNSIKKLEPFFVMDQTSFYNWIYEVKAPNEFQSLYKLHRNFEEFFHILSFVRVYRAFPKIFYEKFEILDTTITNYYNHLNHLENDGILNVFCDFMDLSEMVMLRIKNKDYHINEDCLIFLRELKETYCTSENSDYDLWTLLVPYSQTLVGMKAEVVKRWYRNKVDFIVGALPKKIEILREQAEFLDLLPSIEELEAAIKKYDSKEERLPLREIYSTL